MKILYIECNMGAAGDMLMAALYELLEDKQAFLDAMNALGLPGVRVEAQAAATCGIAGTHMAVTVHGQEETEGSVPAEAPHPHVHSHGEAHDHDHGHDHDHDHPHDHGAGHHHHATPGHIGELLDGLPLPEEVRRRARRVYDAIAQAEAKAHGCPVGDVHFHEVGALDAVADVAGVCYALYLLAPERIVVSPIHVGSGTVRCAHGVMPVPAPATANLLSGVPIYGGAVQGELCTPTGAALLKHFVQRFGPSPVMRVEKTGYGMGKKDFEAANCVRAMLGQTQEESTTIAQLACNLDDMTPEALGFAQERLWETGALDVTTAPIGMKKNRPGVQLTCLCRLEDREKLVSVFFAHTTTLGVRESLCARYTLARSQRTVETEHGPVRVKEARGWGVTREKPEYEDVANIAREQGLTLDQVKELLQ